MIKFLIIVAVLFVVLVTSYVLSGLCADYAKEKGYKWDKYFWICFILGVTGYFYVAALPDQTARRKLASIRSCG